MKKAAGNYWLFLGLGIAWGCGGTEPTLTVPVAQVTVSPQNRNLEIGEALAFTATALDASGNVLNGRPVTWGTDNPSVATVSSAGLVTAVATGGPVTITATVEGKSGSSKVTVVAIPASVTRAILDPVLPQSTRTAVSNLVSAFGTSPMANDRGALNLPAASEGSLLLAFGRDTVYALGRVRQGAVVQLGAESSAATIALMFFGSRASDATQSDGLLHELSGSVAYQEFLSAMRLRLSAGKTPLDSAWIAPYLGSLAVLVQHLGPPSTGPGLAPLPGGFWVGQTGLLRVSDGPGTDLTTTNQSRIFWSASTNDLFTNVSSGAVPILPQAMAAVPAANGISRVSFDQPADAHSKNILLGTTALLNLISNVVPLPANATCLTGIALVFQAVLTQPAFVTAAGSGDINAALNQLVFGITQNYGALSEAILSCLTLDAVARKAFETTFGFLFKLIGAALVAYQDLPVIVDVGRGLAFPTDQVDICQQAGALVPCGNATVSFAQPTSSVATVQTNAQFWQVDCSAPYTVTVSGGDAALFGEVGGYIDGALVLSGQSQVRGGQTGFEISGVLSARVFYPAVRDSMPIPPPPQFSMGQQLRWQVLSSPELGSLSTPIVTTICSIGGGAATAAADPRSETPPAIRPAVMTTMPIREMR